LRVAPYLGFGNDFGGLAAKVLDKLGRDSETDAIDGFLHVNRETEIQSHLEKKIRDSSLSLEKAINHAGDYLFL
jgi:hypothetical protein